MANTLEMSNVVVDVARDLRIDFLKLAPLHDFKTSSRAVKKL